MINILCRVSGGVTGTREELLKSRDGSIQEFGTRAEAQAVADRLTADMNASQARKTMTPRATFRYTVVEN